MLPALAAVRTSLDAPPSFPTGNSAWTGGFRRLVMAFSGLPTLIPMVEVVCLPSRIPESWRTNSDGASGWRAGYFVGTDSEELLQHERGVAGNQRLLALDLCSTSEV